MLTRFFKKLGLSKIFAIQFNRNAAVPYIVPRSKHNISRSQISRQALKVLYRLREAGFQAYLVGGGVRDVLLNRHPKDFDVATDAKPEEIQQIFNNCRLIGRRFRLAHIHFGGHIIEVATFRASGYENVIHAESGMLVRDNIYGTLEEDVQRRDFTINAIYYNIADFTLLDFVGGLKDLQAKILRVIGDPKTRYREDPVRILRIIRFAAKLGFTIEKKSEAAIHALKQLLSNVPSARLFDEYLKLFLSGYAYLSFCLLQKYHILPILFAQTSAALEMDKTKQYETFIMLALKNTDKRFEEEKPIAPAFLLAVLLWPALEILYKEKLAYGVFESQAFYEACSEVLSLQQKNIAIPRRLTQIIRDVWILQHRLQRRNGRRAFQIFTHAKFRAAYDFCLLRAEAGDEEAKNLAKWWTDFVNGDEETRKQMVINIQRAENKTKGRKNKGKRPKKIEKTG